MLAFAVAAFAAFLRWQDSGRPAWLWTAAAATSLSILVKSPGAFIGLVIAGAWLEALTLKLRA